MKKINFNIVTSIISMALIIVIIYILYDKYMTINANKSNKESTEEKEIIFNTEGSEKLFTISNVIEVIINEKKYQKINISMNNNTLIDAMMNKYLFEIVTDEDESISVCHFDSYNPDKLEVNDMFPQIAIANQITNGNLYCPMNDLVPVSLKMTYIIEEDKPVTDGDIKTGIYYFDIKNKIDES